MILIARLRAGIEVQEKMQGNPGVVTRDSEEWESWKSRSYCFPVMCRPCRLMQNHPTCIGSYGVLGSPSY